MAADATVNRQDAPGGYRRPVEAFWWLRRRAYVVFVLRELSAVFVAWFVVFLLYLVAALDAGERQYHQFLQVSAQPPVLVLNATALVFAVLHAVTWFDQTPAAVVLRVRGRRVPRGWVVTAMYLFWAAASALTGWVTLGGAG